MSGLFDEVTLPSTKLGDVVTEHLTRAIIDGRLKPGDSLPSESQIAGAFGVSKQVAREAIRELAALGVVQIQQGKMSKIRLVDHEPLARFYRFALAGNSAGLRHAVELRRVLEVPIARLAAERRDAEQLKEIRNALLRMKLSLGDAAAWIETDLDFHQVLSQATGNKLLQFQIFGLRPLIREVNQAFNYRRSPIDWERTYSRHEAIVDAIEAGEGEAAANAMTRHFEAADQAIREIYPAETGRTKDDQ